MNKVLQRILEDVEYNVPYNSVTPFYRSFTPYQPYRQFGTACVWQSYACKLAAEKEGYRAWLARCNRHLAALVEADGDTFLLDPYLLPTVPVSMRDVAASPQGLQVPAFPICQTDQGPTESYLHVRWDEAGERLRLTYYRYLPRERRHQAKNRFRLELDHPIDALPKWDQIPASFRELLYHPEQKTLSVRTLNPATQSLTQLSYPVSEFRSRSIARERLQICTNDGTTLTWDSDGPFLVELEQMAAVLGCTTDNLIDFILGGVDVYERNAPSASDCRLRNAA